MELKGPSHGLEYSGYKKKPPIFDGIEDKSYFYFVHSFYVVPEDKDIIAGTTEYGVNFTAMVWKDNVFAMQFHPEKSQNWG